MRELLTRANGGLDSAVIAGHLSDMAALSLKTLTIEKLGQDMRYPSAEICGSCFEPKIDPGAVVKCSKMARLNAARFGIFPQSKIR
jgi:hypothetical protein